MKINQTFECERCGKRYETEKEALNCEQKHHSEDKISSAKKDISLKISEMINMYIDKFGELPTIEFTKSNRELLTRTTFDNICDILADILVD